MKCLRRVTVGRAYRNKLMSAFACRARRPSNPGGADGHSDASTLHASAQALAQARGQQGYAFRYQGCLAWRHSPSIGVPTQYLSHYLNRKRDDSTHVRIGGKEWVGGRKGQRLAGFWLPWSELWRNLEFDLLSVQSHGWFRRRTQRGQFSVRKCASLNMQ